MPVGDHTGPRGERPKTGRAAGYCAGFESPGYVNRGPGFRFGAVGAGERRLLAAWVLCHQPGGLAAWGYWLAAVWPADAVASLERAKPTATLLRVEEAYSGANQLL